MFSRVAALAHCRCRYNRLWEVDLEQLPLSSLAADGALIVVWVTNKQKLLRYVQEKLFPAWGVQQAAQWLWLKVPVVYSSPADPRSGSTGEAATSISLASDSIFKILKVKEESCRAKLGGHITFRQSSSFPKPSLVKTSLAG